MRKLLVATLFVLSTFYAAQASAMGASAGLLVGNGFKDGYNLGIGARAGITLPMSIYVGGTFVYHLGKSESTGAGDVTSNLFYFGPEGGYDIAAGPLTIRPYLGLGYTHFMASIPQTCVGSICAPGGSSSTGKLAFWPGVTALVGLGGFFVGADARYVAVIDVEDGNAFALFATGGLSF